MTNRCVFMAILALGLLTAAPARAAPADPCARLFVPEGYALDCTVRGDLADRWRLVVHPETGAFAALSELSVEPVEEPIADPQAWLREQLTMDLGGFQLAMRELTEGPDSPFTDPQFAQALEAWLGLVTSLAELPLQGCDEPLATTHGAASELACDWRLGPFHQHLLTRLVERGDQVYAIRIRAMNERRLRHLVAIANSF